MIDHAPAVKVLDLWDIGGNLVCELDFCARFRRAAGLADAALDASVENYGDLLVLLLADALVS